MRLFFRDSFVRLHRYLGLLLAGFLVISGVTGSMIAFEAELDAWLNPELFEITESGQRTLSPSKLVDRIAQQNPYVHVYHVPITGVASKAIVVYVEPETNAETGEPFEIDYDELFVNPVTGEIKGQRMWGKCCLERKNLLPVLYKLHNRLMLPKPWGSRLLGIVALLWLFMSMIGIYLTLPRTPPVLKNWKASWNFKWKHPPLRGILQLHRAGGLWFWLMFVSMALTGASMNLEKELFKPLLNSISSFTEKSTTGQSRAEYEDISFDEANRITRQHAATSAYSHREVSLISYSKTKRQFTVELSTVAGAGIGPVVVYIDATNGQLQHLKIPGEGTVADLLYNILLPLHSGHIAGLTGRILVALTGLFVAMVSITGVLMWWKKRGRKQR